MKIPSALRFRQYVASCCPGAGQSHVVMKFRSVTLRYTKLAASMLVVLLVLPALVCIAPSHANQELVIGSKRFTESYILGQIIQQIAESAAETGVVSRQGLGNTAIVFAALRGKNIDLYPEYTGTVAHDLLHLPNTPDAAELNNRLHQQGLALGVPLGFNDTYGLAMEESAAKRLGIEKISDLAKHPELKLGLSHEFLQRTDGWPGLKPAYGLPFSSPQGFDHDLAYQAMGQHRIDVVDVYSTDAKILKYHLKVLDDDKQFFPRYDAMLLYQKDVPERFPKSWAAISKLQGAIAAPKMIEMNGKMELEHMDAAVIAADFLAQNLHVKRDTASSAGSAHTLMGQLFAPDFLRLTWQHLYLVFVSLFFGVAVGVPLGILAARQNALAQPILSTVGLIQTVPSLALLAFLIPLLHTVGALPAIIALFLYSLLPIVRNTYTGLTEIPSALRESARALGLPSAARLRLIELPLAARSILSGVKTSAVINVGTATIAAFIGAGGYGERIVSGLATGDDLVLLAGALPSAALALIVQAMFDLLETRVVPAGLRIKQTR